jgi:hypothetical protein
MLIHRRLKLANSCRTPSALRSQHLIPHQGFETRSKSNPSQCIDVLLAKRQYFEVEPRGVELHLKEHSCLFAVVRVGWCTNWCIGVRQALTLLHSLL